MRVSNYFDLKAIPTVYKSRIHMMILSNYFDKKEASTILYCNSTSE
jgi:hypothetical protein